VIAYKCKEVGPLEIGFMTTFTDEYYGRPEVVQMEQDILATARFSITQLLPVTLLCHIKMKMPFHQSKAPSNTLFVHVCSKDHGQGDHSKSVYEGFLEYLLMKRQGPHRVYELYSDE
jgi:hypothetical protein